MRKQIALINLLVAGLFFCTDPDAMAGCPAPFSTVEIKSQADVDYYNQNYSDCAVFREVTLNISNMTDLSFLANLTQVTQLQISNSPFVTSLSGLRNLKSVGAHLYLSELGVSDLSGLGQLERVGGGVNISRMPAITSVSGLSALSFANAILIDNNPLLTRIDGFQNLGSVGVYLIIDGNPSLTTINGFQSLTAIGSPYSYSNIHDLRISNCLALTSLNAFGNLISIAGVLTLNNVGLSNLAGLERLTHIGMGVNVSGMPSLTSLSGLSAVSQTHRIDILNNPSLTSFNAFQRVTSMSGGVEIHNNPVLLDLNGLQNLVSIQEGLSLYQLGITNLEGLEKLKSVGSGLSIEQLPQLRSLAGLSSLETVGTFVNVVYNASLSECALSIFCAKLAETPDQVGFRGNTGWCSTNEAVTQACNGLPVTLVSFGVSSQGQTAHLSWATTEETNSDYFEIQHTTDAITWEVLGQVRSEGESTTPQDYEFYHQMGSNGIHYYRLRMVDKDGTFAYSQIKNLSAEGIEGVLAYPNPVTDILKLKNAGNIERIEIFGITGVHVLTMVGIASESIDLSRLSPGLYKLRLIGAGNPVPVITFLKY